MPDFSFLILYVDNPPSSATFYAGLLGSPIVEQSPTFAMLPLREGVMLGLWSRHTVEPAAAGAAGC
ncbi:MAG: drug:proton antiporter, partial [Bradyrhizobium sp.]|nr:drug:proton antiporter [Bradyrhizobium sp.]